MNEWLVSRGEEKRCVGCVVSRARQGAQLLSSPLFVLIELRRSTQLIPPPPPSSPQHLIRQLTPPSAVPAGGAGGSGGRGGSVACQMLGWESLLFLAVECVFFFFLPFLPLSFVVGRSLEPRV